MRDSQENSHPQCLTLCVFTRRLNLSKQGFGFLCGLMTPAAAAQRIGTNDAEGISESENSKCKRRD